MANAPFDFNFSIAAEKLLGLKPEEAEEAIERIDVDQMIDLIDALQHNDRARAEAILHMHTESLHPALQPIDENEILITEGFNFSIKALTDVVRDKISDWMDEHGFAFELAPERRILIRCDTRDDAYAISRALTRINQRYLRDHEERSAPSIEEVMMKKNERKKWKSNKMTIPGKRTNPLQGVIGTKQFHSVPHRSRRDAFRAGETKHKKKDMEEMDESFNIGDKVNFGEQEATVKFPHGPVGADGVGTVGILLDGEVQMVRETDLERVDETGVFAMSMMPGLQRMRELAGIDALSEDEMSSLLGSHPPAVAAAEASAPPMAGSPAAAPMPAQPMGAADDLATDEFDDGGDDEFGGMAPEMGADMGPDTSMEPDMEPSMAEPGMEPDMAEPMEPAMGDDMGSDMGDAYGQIDDALNNIQRALADVKVSEYKGLVKRLEDLTSKARQMGHDFLGEGKKAIRKVSESAMAEAKPANPGVVIIKKTPDGEFRTNLMNGPEATAYYASDLDDAVGTAKHAWPSARIMFRSKEVGKAAAKPAMETAKPAVKQIKETIKAKPTGRVAETALPSIRDYLKRA